MKRKQKTLKQLEKEIEFIEAQLGRGKQFNRGHLDGWTLQGLEEKLGTLTEKLNTLKGSK